MIAASAATHLPLIVVTGLQAEARIAAGPGVITVSGGGDAGRLAWMLRTPLDEGACAVLSFGIAGGLAPELATGAVIVASTVTTGASQWATDPAWNDALLSALPHALSGVLLGVDQAVPDAAAKAANHRASGAVAVDMESHVAARLAAEHRLPFAAIRVVADPAQRTLPQAALVGMRPDGRTDVGAVLRALARRPADLPGLIRTGLEAGAAFRALKRCRASLDARFALPSRVPA